MRALSISNILRGFSFLPGNEHQLSKHHGLLRVIGRFLTLYSDETEVVRNPPKRLDIVSFIYRNLSYRDIAPSIFFLSICLLTDCPLWKAVLLKCSIMRYRTHDL